jgi:hypothetical protein
LLSAALAFCWTCCTLTFGIETAETAKKTQGNTEFSDTVLCMESFENNVLADPASWETFPKKPGNLIVWDDKVARDGAHSIRMEPSKGHVILTRTFPVKGSGFIQAAAQAKTENASGRTYIRLAFYSGDKLIEKVIDGGTLQSHTYYLLGNIAGTADWTPVMVRGRVPPEATSVQISLLTQNNSSGLAWFDSLVVRQLPPEWGQGELLKNPVKIDASKLNTSDYVTIQNGHLFRHGQRLRIWSAQGGIHRAESYAAIDREIAAFAEHGFNGYRTLNWGNDPDAAYTPGDYSMHQDMFDYMLAQMGQKGIFIWLDLLNGCRIKPGDVDVISDPASAEEWGAAIKANSGDAGAIVRTALFLVWDERSEKVYHNYIVKMMNHTNKHNGLKYGEDPAIFCWELTNEQWWPMRILWGNHLKLPAYLQKGLYSKWNLWLKQKYKTQDKLVQSWGSAISGESLEKGTVLLLPLLGNTEPSALAQVQGLDVKFEKGAYGPKDLPEKRGQDVMAFLYSTLIDHKQRAAAVLKSQCLPGKGCQVVPVVYDTGYSGNIHSYYLQSYADASTCGFYQDMRSFDPKCETFPFASGLSAPPVISGWLDTRRVAGKPLFVYENMIFAPQKYRAEYAYRLAAWAALQDADVVDFHYYGVSLPFGEEKNRNTMTLLCRMSAKQVTAGLTMRMDETLMTTVRLAGEIFKRGYLETPSSPVTVTLGAKTIFDMTETKAREYDKLAYNAVYSKGFQWKFDPSTNEDALGALPGKDVIPEDILKPTRQIEYRWKDKLLVINDAHAKAVIGFLPSDSFEFPDDGLRLRDISICIPKNMPFVIKDERYVAFGMVSLDGKPLKESAHILVSAINTSFNSGMTIDLEKLAADKAYAYGLARSITSGGSFPILSGRVGMTLQADWLEGRSFRMTDYNGNVLGSGECQGGAIRIPEELPVYMLEISKTGK